MYKFYAFINRMKHIKRWSLMRSVNEENIMEHTEQVAVIAHALALINVKKYNGNADVSKTVMYAQYHEVGEVITGDLPTPIKYFNPEIKTAYKGLEKNACEKIINMLPEEFKDEYRQYILPDETSLEYTLAKCADRLSAYVKCIEELKAGNTEFKKAKESIEKDLKSRKIKEVDYFMKEFIPAFSLTLDELD